MAKPLWVVRHGLKVFVQNGGVYDPKPSFLCKAVCGEELPSADSSARLAPTEARLTASVLPAPTPALELGSDRSRSVPSVGPADRDELVRGSNAFAFDLYHALKDGDGNLFYKT